MDRASSGDSQTAVSSARLITKLANMSTLSKSLSEGSAASEQTASIATAQPNLDEFKALLLEIDPNSKKLQEGLNLVSQFIPGLLSTD